MTEATLPDYLGPDLDLLSIGLNPSLSSVRAGFYFANPRNRFWPALNAAGLVPEQLAPGPTTIEKLFQVYHIGWTDVVKRPTAGAGDLRAADYRRDAPMLRERIVHYRPRIAWFHGKVAIGQFLRHAGFDLAAVEWGDQPFRIGTSRVYVTPNPSPANAAYSLDDLVGHYRALAGLLDALR